MRSRFKKRKGVQMDIPTGPMADISFLLIIFFMVTTVFVVYRGFHVDLPRAEKIDPLMRKRNVISIWVGADGRIMVDEFGTTVDGVGGIVSGKLSENPRLVVQVKADQNTPYHLVSGVIEELKRANALKVSFVAKKE